MPSQSQVIKKLKILLPSREQHFLCQCLFFWLFFLATPFGWAQENNNFTQKIPVEPNLPQQPSIEQETDIPNTITVEQFQFVGSTVFSQERLQEVTAGFTNQPVTFAQLLQAANEVTQLYVDNGYITSGAYIPSQELQNGIVTIQIVEGSLQEINVEVTESRLNFGYVRSRLALAASQPLNINRLQEAVQLLQIDPLIESLNVELSAGTRPGTNILDVTVIGAETFNAQVTLDNNRNPSVGSFSRGVEISEANLSGIGDAVGLAYSNTDGSDQFAANYTLPMNSRNGTLSIDYAVSNNDIIEEPLDDADIEVDISQFNLTYRQPLFQRATAQSSQEFAISLTASRLTSDSEVFGLEFPLFPGADAQGETRLSVLRFGQEWTGRGRQEVIAANSRFSFGFDVFDATTSDLEPDGEFFAWRGQLLYLRLLSETVDPTNSPTLLLRSDVQLTTDPLVSLEQFSLGGQDTVRGYRQSALLGDSGILASAEMRLPVWQVPRWDANLQIAPFADFGTAWNVNRENQDPDTILGIGVGVIWQVGTDFAARVDWGIPLVDDNDSGDDETWQENGVYFQLEYNFNPF